MAMGQDAAINALSDRISSVSERTAKLEMAEITARNDMAEIKKDVKYLVRALNQMTGGKKAMMGLCGLIGFAIAAIPTLFLLFGKKL